MNHAGMPPSAPELPREITIPIRYDDGAGRPKNQGMKGEGHLVIRPAGPTYVFEGSVRAAFSTQRRSLEFKSSDIWNVAVLGSRVQFMPSRSDPRGKGLFVFYCANPEEALLVARMMPANVEPDFAASVNFSRKLWSRQSTGVARWATVTNGIIALNVAVYVVMAGFLGAGWLQPTSLRPYVLYGANNGGATTDGEWWRLLTSMFMHFGLLHIAFNMWAYYQAGHLTERLFGKRLYLLGYLAAGLAGGFASIFWNGDKVWSAGASGAIFGVYGMIMGYLLREKGAFPPGVFKPMIRSTVGFAVYNLVFGSVYQGIDNSAHVGGLVMGVLLGWFMALPLDGPERSRLFPRRLATGLFLTAVLIVAGVSLTPCFDYHFREELAWSDVVTPFIKQEPAFERRFHQDLSDLQSGSLKAGELRWVSETCIPFYERWLDSARALHLTPGLATARRRAKLERMLDEQLAMCRRWVRQAGGQTGAQPPEI